MCFVSNCESLSVQIRQETDGRIVSVCDTPAAAAEVQVSANVMSEPRRRIHARARAGPPRVPVLAPVYEFPPEAMPSWHYNQYVNLPVLRQPYEEEEFPHRINLCRYPAGPPPDYETLTGTFPPTYEEAIRMRDDSVNDLSSAAVYQAIPVTTVLTSSDEDCPSYQCNSVNSFDIESEESNSSSELQLVIIN